jgi:HAE1 family hydrophobic/amphiphilic exporter-1
MPLVEATLEAGRARLRPVLMTSCTTVLAMIPLALELGEGAEMWSPMARTVIGGLTASTLLTLVVVPSVYVTFAGYVERRRATAGTTFPVPREVAAPAPSPPTSR